MRYEYRSYTGKIVSVEANNKESADVILKAWILEVTQPAPIAVREIATVESIGLVSDKQGE